MSESSTKRPRYFWWIALAVFLGGLGLRLWKLGSASLWFDEAVTDFGLRRPSDRFYVLILESGTELPLYFTMLRPLPTQIETLLRLPSVFFGIIGIILIIFIVIKLYRQFDLALLAGALLAFSPFHIWLSRTARPYTLLFVLSLLVSYFFLQLFQRKESRANWTGFIFASMGAYLTHYFALGLPLAEYVLFAFIMRGRKKFFRRWTLAQFIAVAPVLLWIYALASQKTIEFGIGWIPKPHVIDILYLCTF